MISKLGSSVRNNGLGHTM
jgi:hypothetical protein